MFVKDEEEAAATFSKKDTSKWRLLSERAEERSKTFAMIESSEVK